MSQPRPVAVLFGGVSPEHEVSIQSAAKVASAIAALEQWAPVPIYVTKKGKWHWSRPSSATSPGDLVLAVENEEAFARNYQPGGLDFAQALLHMTVDEYVTTVIMIHGPYGEDGRLQGAFELAGLRYCGSNSTSSALALDKARTQAVLSARGLPVPPFRVLNRRSLLDANVVMEAMDGIGFPCVVKPSAQGSSVGVTIVPDGHRFSEALKKAFEHGSEVLVEKFVVGREFTCAVLERPSEKTIEPEALPVIEIIPPEGRFFDYDAKYTPGVSREICPAQIPNELTAKLQSLAVETHRAIGCRGFSRVDFISAEGEPLILEINTIPGMTGTSLVPQAAAAAGIDFPELMRIIMEQSAAKPAAEDMPHACHA